MRAVIAVVFLVATRAADAAPMTGVVHIGAGGDNACAVLKSGEVACWGDVGHGLAREPSLVPRIHGAVSVSVADNGRCAVLKSGEVWCWGVDWYTGRGLTTWGHGGQPPEPVHGIRDATQVTTGFGGACARHKSGAVSCWGDNRYGHLGAKTNDERSTVPVAVPGITNAVEVAASVIGTCARLATGQVSCWHGDHKTTAPTTVPGISDAVALALDQKVCAVRSNGRVACWSMDTPSDVTDMNVERVVSIASASSKTCVVDAGGVTRCWGYGILGDGARHDKDSPPVVVQNVNDAKQVAVGWNFACVRRADTASCWGENYDSQLGRATPDAVGAPVTVRGVSRAKAVAVGHTAACALTNDGVTCWGHGKPAAKIAGTSDAVKLAVGERRACVTTKAGDVACWLLETHGPAVSTKRTDVAHVAIVDGHVGEDTCTVHRDGTLTCTPTLGAPGLTNIADAALGTSQACFRSKAGEVRCWEQRRKALTTIGTGIRQVATTGAPVCTLSTTSNVRCRGGIEIRIGNSVRGGNDLASVDEEGIEQIAVGFAHACIRRKTGSIACWGDNLHGQLGAGKIESVVHPLADVAVPPSIDLAANKNTTCAVHRDGTVSCWGNNASGQVGDGTTGTAFTITLPVEAPSYRAP